MHECRKVDLSYFETAPARFQAEVVIAADPERIFEVFEDAHAWTVWALPITAVHWTSPRPFGVGTTRTVHMIGSMIGEEQFIAWERGKRMAFYFTRCSKSNVAAFAEDYHVEDLGDGRCRVSWMMAMEPSGPSRLTMPLMGPPMRAGLAFMLRRLKKYVEKR
jgi:uncharacterized protein YndB with AHSA1/START domain